MDQSGFEEAAAAEAPGLREGLTGLGWLEELESESLELEDPDPEPELSESRAAPWEKYQFSLLNNLTRVLGRFLHEIQLILTV